MLLRYWERKPESLIEKYIDYTSDVVLDPFGGSGLIVRYVAERGKEGIYVDINPYAYLVAFVNTQPIDKSEFKEKAYEVLEIARKMRTRKRVLSNDYLYYKDGKSFLKKEKVERVSELFTLDSFRKLYTILKAIDKVVDSGIQFPTAIALYGAFCATLFPSSKMKRKNAGSWGVPSYWVPEKHEEQDPYQVFERQIENFSRKFITKQLNVKLFLGNALTFKYGKYRSATLFTDPPFFDEIQYMELSFFYWAWLKESKFPLLLKKYIGKRVTFSFSEEIVYNPVRNDKISYEQKLELFLKKTKKMKEKILIFHEENEKVRNRIIEKINNIWGRIEIETEVVHNHRKIGKRGGNEYIIVISS
ncbi:DNA methyltransferase [Sulfurisphaera javensis]